MSTLVKIRDIYMSYWKLDPLGEYYGTINAQLMFNDVLEMVDNAGRVKEMDISVTTARIQFDNELDVRVKLQSLVSLAKGISEIIKIMPEQVQENKI